MPTSDRNPNGALEPQSFEPQSFTVSETSALLGIRRTVRQRVMRGELHPVRLGRVRFARSELERVLGHPISADDIWRAQQKAKADHRAERQAA